MSLRSSHQGVSLLELLVLEEFVNQSLVLSIGGIKSPLLVVLELRVVNHLLGNFESSEHPDGHDVKLGLFTDDGHDGPGVLSELVASLDETLHEILGLVEHLALFLVLFVLSVPPCVAGRVEFCVKLSRAAFTLTHEEVGLEGEHVEGAWGQSV